MTVRSWRRLRDDGEREESTRAPCLSLGLVLVTASALLFGIVAAFIKAIDVPTLVLQLVRSLIEWLLGIIAALVYRKKQQPTSNLVLLLFGPAELRGWLVLRAFLYWVFIAGWWFALASMPMGDATTIVYVGPVFTATFAFLFLGETVDWSFYPIVALDAVGLLLITQPSFAFGGPANDESYFLGALSALASAVVAGLLPVCVRKSRMCLWTAVNHCSSALSALVFSPAAILAWLWYKPAAWAEASAGLGELLLVRNCALLVGATLVGFLGLSFQTRGYQLEQAARASVMTVLEIPFAYVLQYALFHEELSLLGLLGVVVVCSATVLNLVRRQQLNDAAAS